MALPCKATERVEVARVGVFKTLIGCLCLLLALSLCGCRFTDELTEYIYDPAYGEENDQFDPLYQEVDGAREDPTRVSAIERPSTNYAMQEVALPTYDADAEAGVPTKQRVYDPESVSDLAASEGTLADINEAKTGTATTDQVSEKGSGQRSEPDSVPNDDPDDGTTKSNGDGKDSDAGEGRQGGDEATGGSGGTGVVYDGGTFEELPEDVQCVAACGSYAYVVQMLAGANALVAADETTLSAMLAATEKGAFSYTVRGEYDRTHEGLTSVVAAWSGTGADEGSLDAQALINAFTPWLSRGLGCAVLTDGSTPYLSEGDRDTLVDAGIDIVYVPLLGASDTSDSDILEGVQVVGELLRNSQSEYDSAMMAARYTDLHNTVLDKCQQTNHGYSFKAGYEFLYQGSAGGTATTRLQSTRVSTAYVADWVSANGVLAKGAQQSGGSAGLPLYRDGEEVRITGIAVSDKTSGGFALVDYYLQHVGVVNNAYDVSIPLGHYRIIPGSIDDLSSITSYEFSQRLYNGSALSYASDGSYTWCKLGDAAFPALMVASDEIAQNIESSANDVMGLYNMGQSYQIHVVPSGLSGSWASGTPESYLVSAWALCKYRSADYSFLEKHASDFYNAFYRCESTSSSTNYRDLISDYDNTRTASCPTQ